MSLSQKDPRFRALNTNIDFVARLMQLEQFIKNVMDVFEQDFCEWHLNSNLLMHFYPLLAPLALDLNLIICRYRQNFHDYTQTLNLGLDEELLLEDDLPSLHGDDEDFESGIFNDNDHDSSSEEIHESTDDDEDDDNDNGDASSKDSYYSSDDDDYDNDNNDDYNHGHDGNNNNDGYSTDDYSDDSSNGSDNDNDNDNFSQDDIWVYYYETYNFEPNHSSFDNDPTFFDTLPHQPLCFCVYCENSIRPACLLNQPWGQILGISITNQIAQTNNKYLSYKNYIKPLLRKNLQEYLSTLHPKALMKKSKQDMHNYLHKDLLGIPPLIAPENYMPSHRDIFYKTPKDNFYKDTTIWDNFSHPADCKCSFSCQSYKASDIKNYPWNLILGNQCILEISNEKVFDRFCRAYRKHVYLENLQKSQKVQQNICKPSDNFSNINTLGGNSKGYVQVTIHFGNLRQKTMALLDSGNSCKFSGCLKGQFARKLNLPIESRADIVVGSASSSHNMSVEGIANFQMGIQIGTAYVLFDMHCLVITDLSDNLNLGSHFLKQHNVSLLFDKHKPMVLQFKEYGVVQSVHSITQDKSYMNMATASKNSKLPRNEFSKNLESPQNKFPENPESPWNKFSENPKSLMHMATADKISKLPRNKFTKIPGSLQAESVTIPSCVSIRKANLINRGFRNFKDWNSHHSNLYIGRDNNYVPGIIGSKWQNPFQIKKYGLAQCLILYEKKIRNDPDLMNAIPELNGKELGCWCKPSACHGDILIKLFKEHFNIIEDHDNHQSFSHQNKSFNNNINDLPPRNKNTDLPLQSKNSPIQYISSDTKLTDLPLPVNNSDFHFLKGKVFKLKSAKQQFISKNQVGQVKGYVDKAPPNNFCFLVLPASPFNTDTFGGL